MELNQDPEQFIKRVITVKECMSLFKLKDKKTVIMACATGRLISRKADQPIGQIGGVWLIDLSSAKAIWGHRNE